MGGLQFGSRLPAAHAAGRARGKLFKAVLAVRCCGLMPCAARAGWATCGLRVHSAAARSLHVTQLLDARGSRGGGLEVTGRAALCGPAHQPCTRNRLPWSQLYRAAELLSNHAVQLPVQLTVGLPPSPCPPFEQGDLGGPRPRPGGDPEPDSGDEDVSPGQIIRCALCKFCELTGLCMVNSEPGSSGRTRAPAQTSGAVFQKHLLPVYLRAR